MAKKRDGQSDKQQEYKPPRGVNLFHALEGHQDYVSSLAFNHTGQMLASSSPDLTVKVWDVESGKQLYSLTGHSQGIYGVAFHPAGTMLASGSYDETVKLWGTDDGELIHTIAAHGFYFLSIAFDHSGRMLAGTDYIGTLRVWDVKSGKLLYSRKGYGDTLAFAPAGPLLACGDNNKEINLVDVGSGKRLSALKGVGESILGLAFDPSGAVLAGGDSDTTVKLWGVVSGKLLRTLEGHTGHVDAVAFSADGRLLASKSKDGTVRLWNCETWETVAVIRESPQTRTWIPSLAFHPVLPILAASGSGRNVGQNEDRLIHLWALNYDVLLASLPRAAAIEAVHHTTAKVVLVGDSGVGKTGLGWRLAHKEFKEHSSTHGQQFWVVDELGMRRDDGTECEAILWDLAGQPDYRLTHALFLDDSDLALLLFDPTDSRDPLHGVEFWLKQLRSGRRKGGEAGDCCPTILVGARADRGEARLTGEELGAFCRQRGISGGYLATSAKEGLGLAELLRRMKEQIAWEDKAATVTTVTFKRIKDYVLGLKENRRRRKVIVTPQELRRRLEQLDRGWEFTDAEMMTAVGHLANYGYVRVLRTSEGEERVLLLPELLNNLAASFVLEARRNPKGLGSLQERALLAGEYQFRELEKLSEEERDILLDSAALLFIEHNVCFREAALDGQAYLVFPELINLKKPVLDDERPTEDGASYSVSGAVENLYALLVVLLGYTQTFTRTDQWQNQARYVMGDGSICGFRQEAEREGELDFVLYFGEGVPGPGRKVFEGLFESFLSRRKVTAFRYEPVACRRGHTINRFVVRKRLRDGKGFAFCEECGERAVLPKADEPVRLTQDERREVDQQRWLADRRTRFEQAVFRLSSYVEDQKLDRPECFVSYAWGDAAQERWVEKSLATDLQKAGITVLLDKWENSRFGSNILRFVERVEDCDYVIVVGTPLYRKKARSVTSAGGHVVAAEWDLAGMRMLAAGSEKMTVLPVLLEGEPSEALPALLLPKVFADFRDERAYFATAFDLILSLYDIPFNHRAVADLRESLRGPELG